MGHFPYVLSKHAFVCHCEDCYVILDWRASRYWQLSGDGAAKLADFVAGWPPSPRGSTSPSPTASAEARCLISRMLSLGILIDRGAEREQRDVAGVPRPLKALIHHDGVMFSTPRVHHIVTFIIALLTIEISLKFRAMRFITWRRRRRSSLLDSSKTVDSFGEELLALIGAFNWLRALTLSRQGNCLIEALTLADFLSSYKIYASCVIGVQTKPFKAHSWVQLHDVVLNDRLDVANSFTPIAVL